MGNYNKKKKQKTKNPLLEAGSTYILLWHQAKSRKLAGSILDEVI
jgi:hypothetical protein